MKFLLLDYGATNIKSAIVDLLNGQIKMVEKYSFPPNVKNLKSRFEISVNELKNSFLMICDKYYHKYDAKFDGISISSQMHGFIVLNDRLEPKTNYISWKDERSLEEVGGKITFEHANKNLGYVFREITGMTPRPGIPYFNIFHLARNNEIKNDDIIISLPTWLSLVSNNTKLIEHDTMLAGLGFYNISNRKTSVDLISFLYDNTNIKPKFCERAEIGEVLGYWHSSNKNVPIYLGVGDHQCALLGADVLYEGDVSINLGTGSQVSCVRKSLEKNINAIEYDYRPYFDGNYLKTITHIPSGRVLDEFISFLKDVASNSVNNNFDPWEIVSSLSDEEIINSTLKFDLSIFNGSWNYTTGGKIDQIKFGSLNIHNYLSSLMKSYIEQYIYAIQVLTKGNKNFKYIFSGGIARRLPYITRIFSKLTSCDSISAKDYDETFFGLRAISLINSKIENNCVDALNHKYC